MPAKKSTPPSPAPPEPVVPYFIAAEPLFISDPEGGMPARAYSPGDHVPAHDLDRFGWRGKVTVPPEFQPPASEPAGQDAAPKAEE